MAFNKRQTIKQARFYYYDVQPERGKFEINDAMFDYIFEHLVKEGYDTVKYHDDIIAALSHTDEYYPPQC
jgi:hypothetical protein